MNMDPATINSMAEIIAARLAQPQSEQRMTLDELFDYYLENYAKLHCRTWRDMERTYRPHLSHWGDRDISSFRKREVHELHAAIASKSGKHAANRAMELLRSVFNRCDRIGVIECANPARNFQKIKEEPRDRFLEREEIERFLEAVKNLRYKESRDMLLLLILTGQRRDNVLTMEWSEISFDRANWHIPAVKMKAGRAHDLPLHPDAVKILQGRFDDPKRSKIWVFPGHKASTTASRRDLWRAWKKCVDQAGLKNVRIHDLRRTLASWQVMTGADIRVVAATLSHRDLKSTMVYARLNTEPVRKAICAAGDAMFGGIELNDISGTGDYAGNAFGHGNTVKRLQLTDDFVRTVAIPMESTFVDYYDSEARQLSLRCRDTGGKAFIVFGYLDKKPRFFTLGHPSKMTVQEARNKARIALAAFTKGIHPREVMSHA